ncbi:carbohydrate porin [Sulfuricurvum sp.]|uniref:carbohydrate porin n=1 Tax=Sulfuricurvum sp. TaxID=2025608 RepID=UPI00356223FA
MKNIPLYSLVSMILTGSLYAQDYATTLEPWNASLQTTSIWQYKPSINAPYGVYGDNIHSILPESESTYSVSISPTFGVRAWDGGEIYFTPEMFSTKMMSGMTGLGGLSNGENQRGGSEKPKSYIAKLFFRQTWNLEGDSTTVASGAGQLAGSVSSQRIVLTVGKLALPDIFDNNKYSHNPRTQFMNWSLMSGGAYDYAADIRGYDQGMALEYYDYDWVYRIGRFKEPIIPNGLALDSHFLTHYGDQIEVEHAHSIASQPGKIRALVFLNKMQMGSYSDAIILGQASSETPDQTLVRNEHTKSGYEVGFEQSLSDDIGVFGRYSWCDGKTEMYSFAEIDESLSGGVSIQGTNWKRKDDTFGIAVALNNLSKIHREYLAQGGMDFMIGDGKINYHQEQILETYYSARINKNIWMSLDYQHIINPAYNSDRGPINIYGIRLHMEF